MPVEELETVNDVEVEIDVDVVDEVEALVELEILVVLVEVEVVVVVEELVVVTGADTTPKAVPKYGSVADKEAVTLRLLTGEENCCHSAYTVGWPEYENALNPVPVVTVEAEAIANIPNTNSLELAVFTGYTSIFVAPEDDEVAGVVEGSKGFAGS